MEGTRHVEKLGRGEMREKVKSEERSVPGHWIWRRYNYDVVDEETTSYRENQNPICFYFLFFKIFRAIGRVYIFK